MFDCEESNHNQQEIILVCVNNNCQVKRACCLYCIEKHDSHKQDLKSVKQIKQWKKNTIQRYEQYKTKMSQIVDIMNQVEKYLSSLNENLEISFDEIKNDEFEDQVLNLLRIEQLSSPFNLLISNLETLMEPISQISQKFETSSIDRPQSNLNNSIIQLKSKSQEQQKQQEKNSQKENQDDYQNRKIKKNQTLLDLLEKTYKLRKENDFDIHQYPWQCRSSILNLEEYKTIILIGTQSSGKQNLINLFVNFYYGVEFSDPYRFEINDDIDITKESQNNEHSSTKIYYITPFNGQSGLRIIYTSDYSDDLSYDDQNRFSTICDVIQGSAQLNQNIIICLVIPQQVQIGSFFMLESILSHFSNCLINNIVFLFPDCTDNNPKQKHILKSKSEIINGITSPVSNMIPTMINSWYIKFNTSALFIENKTQENKFLWEMGMKNFQLLLQNYLQNKINKDKFQEMRDKQEEFLRYFDDYKIRDKYKYDFEQIEQTFDKYYRNADLDYLKKISKDQVETIIQIKKMISCVKDEREVTTYRVDKSENICQVRNMLDNLFLKKPYGTIEEDLKKRLISLKDRISNYLFEKFITWASYFKFNSILISINPGQQNYYEHLISKEKSLMQKGWEGRLKSLIYRYNFFIYSFDYFNGSKSSKVEEFLDNWAQYKFSHDAEKLCVCERFNWQLDTIDPILSRQDILFQKKIILKFNFFLKIKIKQQQQQSKNFWTRAMLK